MRNKKAAKDKLMKLASMKLKPYEEPIKGKAEAQLSDIGLNPEMAAKMAAAAQLADQLSQGKLRGSLDIGDLNIEADISPREKALRLGYKKDF